MIASAVAFMLFFLGELDSSLLVLLPQEIYNYLNIDITDTKTVVKVNSDNIITADAGKDNIPGVLPIKLYSRIFQ